MADAGLFIGWGQVVRGREERALEVFNETLQFYGELQSDDRIESFDVCLLSPHGGELNGFVLLQGSEAQMDALRHDDAFQRQMLRADLIVEDLGVIDASVGDGLQRSIATYAEGIALVAQ